MRYQRKREVCEAIPFTGKFTGKIRALVESNPTILIRIKNGNKTDRIIVDPNGKWLSVWPGSYLLAYENGTFGVATPDELKEKFEEVD